MRVVLTLLITSIMVGVVSAAEISDEYGVGTSNTAIFAGVVEKLPFGTHYVYWRESQYVYALAYSETLAFDGAAFTAEDVTVVCYDTSGGYQVAPVFIVDEQVDWELAPEDGLVYSDLGHYPDLIERGGVTYEALACVILCSFAVWYLLERFVRACKRSR